MGTITIRHLVALFVLSAILAGCGTSGKTPHYSATGSWEGTIVDPAGSSHPAEALIAPDGTLHLAVSDSGEQFFGTASVLDNMGLATVLLVRPAPRQLLSGRFKFLLEAGRLTGFVEGDMGRWNVQLRPTAVAAQPANPAGLQGKWSLAPERLFTDLQVGADLKVAGRGGCLWSGQLSAPNASWNLYGVSVYAQGCFDPSMNGIFQGLGTLRTSAEGPVVHLLLASTSNVNSLALDWFATVNQAPVADAGADFSRTILPGATLTLNGSGSSDPNGDSVTFQWSVLQTPGGLPLTLSGADTATPSFTPPPSGGEGAYTFQLSVSDGLLSSQATVTVTVQYAVTLNRFADNGDGTVNDNTSGLVWLKNANCFPLRNADDARLQDVLALASGQCGLTDASVAGNWRLPTRAELLSLVDPAYSNPALSNTAGNGPWQPGDPFDSVQSDRYWTSSGDPASYDPVNDWYLNFYFVDLAYGTSDSMTWSSLNYVWPVRDAFAPAAPARW